MGDKARRRRRSGRVAPLPGWDVDSAPLTPAQEIAAKREWSTSGLPKRVVGLLDDADALVRAWEGREGAPDDDPFIPANYAAVYRALRDLEPRKGFFLEWGSGVGVVTILASFLGFDAYGIEWNPELVRQARELAAKHGAGTTFAEGNFLPTWWEPPSDAHEEEIRSFQGGIDGYAGLELDLEDFDVVYVFPWPAEEMLLFDVFLKGGRESGRFVSYHDHGEVKVRTKHSRRRSP